jgi:hypothetical protein
VRYNFAWAAVFGITLFSSPVEMISCPAFSLSLINGFAGLSAGFIDRQSLVSNLTRLAKGSAP